MRISVLVVWVPGAPVLFLRHQPGQPLSLLSPQSLCDKCKWYPLMCSSVCLARSQVQLGLQNLCLEAHLKKRDYFLNRTIQRSFSSTEPRKVCLYQQCNISPLSWAKPKHITLSGSSNYVMVWTNQFLLHRTNFNQVGVQPQRVQFYLMSREGCRVI